MHRREIEMSGFRIIRENWENPDKSFFNFFHTNLLKQPDSKYEKMCDFPLITFCIFSFFLLL